MAMSKEREAFERITESEYEGEFTKYADGEYVNEAQERHFLEFFSGYRAATAHHRPLLDAKDAEITTLKALLEQAREGLRLFAGCRYPVADVINPSGFEWSDAWLNDALVSAEPIIAAINAVTGEK